MKKLSVVLLAALPVFLFANALKPAGKAVRLKPLAEYTILTPSQSTEQEQFAARVLADHLHRATGVKLKIVREGTAVKGCTIHVGETTVAKSTGTQPDRNSYSIAVKNGDLILRGGIYGVVALLEEDLGFRHYSKRDKLIVPELKSNAISVVPRSYTSPFEIREPLIIDGWGKNDCNWFNRIQPLSYFYNVPESRGGGLSSRQYFIHTYDMLIPAKKYYKTHPEYFPLRNGKRFKSNQHDGQLCYTNPGVAETISREIEGAIKANPGTRIYSVSQNDNDHMNCECPGCQKVIKSSGIPGATLYLANKVAERLATKYPDIRINTLAYVNSQDPVKGIAPSANTVMFYAPIRERSGALMYLPWTDIPKIVKQLAGWKKVAKHIYVWDYINRRFEPFPNFDVIDRNIQYWRENGVTGVFLESSECNLNSLDAMKFWVFAKKMWNPDWKLDALIDDFITGYYGKSAPEMKKYVAFQRKKWNDFYTKRKPGMSVEFTPADREKMQDLLEKAYTKTPDWKIASELCSFYAMTLTACTKKNVVAYEKNLNRVKELLAHHKLKINVAAKQNKRILDQWQQQLAEVKSGNGIPVYCDESIILKNRTLWLKIKATETEGACTGKKVPRQFAKTDWGVQWDFAKFLAAAECPGEYVVRMRVKPDFKGEYKANANAFSLHLWRSGITGVQGRYIKFSALKGNQWQFVYPFKVKVLRAALNGYFYNCAGNLEKGDGIFYDYIEFIPLNKFKDQKLAAELRTITM
ncbi:MAG: DUF4838 domain-containing protein [Lentisphaeria bacterium]|nr:DUF4838 domain-containing protein [Lentisphaeria bacterium]